MRFKKSNLRRRSDSLHESIAFDLNNMIENDGSTITFEWKEVTGGTWNPTYEVWEGGTEEILTLEQKGIGRVIDYAEDEMEYEWGRVSVGDCIVRFDDDFNIEQLKDKEHLRFIYKGQRWKPDSTLGVQEYYGDRPFCKILKGVKSLD